MGETKNVLDYTTITDKKVAMHERNSAISLMRVISMLGIVAYHCMCYNAGIWSIYPCSNVNGTIATLARLIVGLALPAFFFIAGYIYALNFKEKGKYREFFPFLKGKCIRLIIPTITFTVVYLLFFSGEYSLIEIISGIRHLWFLPTLFVCFMLIFLFGNVLIKGGNIVHGGVKLS